MIIAIRSTSWHLNVIRLLNFLNGVLLQIEMTKYITVLVSVSLTRFFIKCQYYLCSFYLILAFQNILHFGTVGHPSVCCYGITVRFIDLLDKMITNVPNMIHKQFMILYCASMIFCLQLINYGVVVQVCMDMPYKKQISFLAKTTRTRDRIYSKKLYRSHEPRLTDHLQTIYRPYSRHSTTSPYLVTLKYSFLLNRSKHILEGPIWSISSGDNLDDFVGRLFWAQQCFHSHFCNLVSRYGALVESILQIVTGSHTLFIGTTSRP